MMQYFSEIKIRKQEFELEISSIPDLKLKDVTHFPRNIQMFEKVSMPVSSMCRHFRHLTPVKFQEMCVDFPTDLKCS